MISFAASKADRELIFKIVERAEALPGWADHGLKRMETVMDITAAHVTCPMLLADLLAADDSNFIHDVAGIIRHLDRTTGKLTGFFTPRFAIPRA